MINVVSVTRPAPVVAEATVTVETDEPTTRSAVLAHALAVLGQSPDSLYGYGIRGEAPGAFRVLNAAGEVVTTTDSWWFLVATMETMPDATWDREPHREDLPAGTYTVYAHRD
jgi:hypothetical protein